MEPPLPESHLSIATISLLSPMTNKKKLIGKAKRFQLFQFININKNDMDIITKEGETPALFVNSITFNNGETIKINKNDIVELSVLIMLEKVNH